MFGYLQLLPRCKFGSDIGSCSPVIMLLWFTHRHVHMPALSSSIDGNTGLMVHWKPRHHDKSRFAVYAQSYHNANCTGETADCRCVTTCGATSNVKVGFLALLVFGKLNTIITGDNYLINTLIHTLNASPAHDEIGRFMDKHICPIQTAD